MRKVGLSCQYQLVFAEGFANFYFQIKFEGAFSEFHRLQRKIHDSQFDLDAKFHHKNVSEIC